MTEELIAVVEAEVAESGAEAIGMLDWYGVAELMADTAQRPLLGEGILPVAVPGSLKGTDVLDDPALLVIRLFEEEAIVLDLTSQRRSAKAEKRVHGER
jgi:hypothetical protein